MFNSTFSKIQKNKKNFKFKKSSKYIKPLKFSNIMQGFLITSLENGFLKKSQFESIYNNINFFLKKKFIFKILIQDNMFLTKRTAFSRMGKGKGKPYCSVIKIKKGQPLFLLQINIEKKYIFLNELNKRIFKNIKNKLPLKVKIKNYFNK